MFNILADSILDNQIFWAISWLIVFILALGVELATEQLVSVWFCGGAVVSGILAACKVNYIIQIIVFVAVSVVLLIFAKTTFGKKLFKSRNQKTNYDALIGEEILITEKVSPKAYGAGKVRDVVWTVVCDSEIEAGEFAVVKEISGNKLIVEKKS